MNGNQKQVRLVLTTRLAEVVDVGFEGTLKSNANLLLKVSEQEHSPSRAPPINGGTFTPDFGNTPTPDALGGADAAVEVA